MIKFTTKKTQGGHTLVSFELEGGVIDNTALAEAVATAPEAPMGKGVILSGRGPIWLFAALTHEYHATPWVACFDPRLGGGVVVQRHHADAPSLGEVVPVE